LAIDVKNTPEYKALEERFNDVARENVFLRDLYLEVESWTPIIYCNNVPQYLKDQWYKCIAKRVEEIQKEFGPIA